MSWKRMWVLIAAASLSTVGALILNPAAPEWALQLIWGVSFLICDRVVD